MSIKWKTAGDNHYGVASHGKYHIGPAGKGSALSYMAHGKANYSPVSSLKAGARGDLKLAAALHHANMKRSSKKSMQYTQGETKMSKELESFEELFKSEGEHCPTCGGEVEVVEKGGKKKLSAKGRGAKRLGNEADPHKGGKTGSFVKQPRTGSLGSQVDREHASKPHKPRSGVVGKSEEAGAALFPMASKVQLVQYTGLGEDAALAKQIEDAQDPQKAHSMYTPSLRNLAVENEGGEQ